jgi:hypothetical protein
MATMVLDRLREAVLDERRKGGTPPREARARVYVTPSGRVVIGDQVEHGEEHMLSEIHPAVFA